MQRIFGLGAVKRAAEGGDLTVDLAIASNKPYERWWGIEILQVDDKSIRLGRLNDGDGGAVLFNHNWNDLRGRHVPGSVKADADGVLRGQIVIPAATQATRDTIALVESKTLTKASVGYQIHRVVEQTTTKAGEKVSREIDGATFERLIDAHTLKRDGRAVGGDLAAFRRGLDDVAGPIERADDDEPVFLVIDWEPHESSLVTVPADNSVGIGRSHVRASAPVSAPAAAAAQPQERSTMDAPNAAAGTNAETKLDPLEVEKQRRTAIGNLCRSYKIDSRIEEQWVRDGTRLEEIADKILQITEERGKANPTTLSDLGMSAKETRDFSLFRVVRALRFGAQNAQFIKDAAYELDCSRAVAQKIGRSDSANFFVPGEVLRRPLGAEAAQRAMGTTPGSKGGYLVSVENMGFIDILRNRSFAMSMGCRVISGLVGNVMFPRQTGKVSVTWQAGEGTSVTAADQALGQLSMTPKTCIAITDVSEQLLRQSSPSAESFIMADLAKDIAIDGVDASVINGAGGAQPLGIKNTTGITSGQDASSATYAKILAFPIAAAGANAVLSNPGWVANAAGAGVLMQKQRFTSTDTPLWDGNLMDGTLVGFRAMSTEQVASGNLIFGSWGEVLIGEWGVLELATDNGGTRFNTAQVGIRAMWMVDVLVRYPQSFVVSTNLSA